MNIKQIVKEIFSNIKKDWYLPVTEHQVYSEQETVVGVWTDGKPLYRKAILSTTSKTGWVTVHTEPEAEMLRVVCCDVNVADEANDWLPASYQSSAPRLCYSVKGNTIKYEMTESGANKPVRLIIEYTKTTDTPTTKKVPFEPLVEYSTDEKMIGYWIDGKPIYRKTFETSLGTGINKNFAYDLNIDMLINSYGVFNRIVNATKTIWQNFNFAHGGSLSGVIQYDITNGVGVVQANIVLGARETTTKQYITIEYTKTTD